MNKSVKKRRDMCSVGEALDYLYSSLGTLVGDDCAKGRKFDRFEQIVSDAIDELADKFCRDDWRAYRAWAWSTDVGAVEPCDAWFELDEPWIDEDGFVPDSPFGSEPSRPAPPQVYLSHGARQILQKQKA